MSERDWIVCHDATCGELAYALECRRCGIVQRIATPISITCYAAMARAFEREHSRCKVRPENHGATEDTERKEGIRD